MISYILVGIPLTFYSKEMLGVYLLSKANVEIVYKMLTKDQEQYEISTWHLIFFPCNLLSWHNSANFNETTSKYNIWLQASEYKALSEWGNRSPPFSKTHQTPHKTEGINLLLLWSHNSQRQLRSGNSSGALMQPW